ncbi:zinc-binding dehydrogenase [Haloechinothrix sp. LS1_15]|uniref:zinc-dependent alcohol dehydrogenase n=1 Tax=Haloechinothrix sp. LS1_15 TaxID=2652248 RepID=UPI002945B003|nr:zinc-binding dehydrogenase [Haloechinothrix sp. LS1_15]MDV6010922.1 zinc-binding dehydrogenase [Haloechinothrix sp. LS1_15]
MILTLEYHRSPVRYMTSRTATGSAIGGRAAGVLAANLSPLRLLNRPEPRRPAGDWTRVRPLLSGICGSDMGLLTGRSSPYLSALVTMPFTPGHEVVGETLDELDDLPRGTRVVIDPVLGCVPRDVEPCEGCASGAHNRCDRVTAGAIPPGMQTGFCGGTGGTGGGWSRMLVAHRSQLHPVPDGLDDREAVLVEPLACAVRSVRRAPIIEGAGVLIVGAGTVGLLTLLALRELTPAGPVSVVARYGHQRERARELGATEVLSPDRAARALRRTTGGFLATPDRGSEFLLGGAEVVFECTGGSGLDTALRVASAGGTVVLSGMPNREVDLTPAWFRELSLVGAYASTAEDFADALSLAQVPAVRGYTDAVYPLSRWRDAVGHASDAGRLGTVKVAFDPNRD